jgi:hypothetical protein
MRSAGVSIDTEAIKGRLLTITLSFDTNRSCPIELEGSYAEDQPGF